jgi:hypothetical protein
MKGIKRVSLRENEKSRGEGESIGDLGVEW